MRFVSVGVCWRCRVFWYVRKVCSRYVHSWFPNATATGAKIFPYAETGSYQGIARTNHSHDRVPYLANVIAGFDPR